LELDLRHTELFLAFLELLIDPVSAVFINFNLPLQISEFRFQAFSFAFDFVAVKLVLFLPCLTLF
jgi:hypothetical protein